MTNRVILGAFAGTHVLRISRPGFNVQDDTLIPEQIAFDSRWASTANIIAQGIVRATHTSGNVAYYLQIFGSKYMAVYIRYCDANYNAIFPSTSFRFSQYEAIDNPVISFALTPTSVVRYIAIGGYDG